MKTISPLALILIALSLAASLQAEEQKTTQAKPGGASAAASVKPAPPETTLSTPTELIVATAFNQDTPPTKKGPVSGWTAGIGEWTVKDGALRGDELEADHHPSSLTYRLEATNLIITAQFKLGTAESISFGCRDTVPPNNHLARTVINPKTFWIQKMSGISKTTKSQKLQEQQVEFDPNKWYPITIEIIGDQYVAHVGEQTITAKNDRFKDAKGIVALIVKGQGGQFKDVALWHAKPK